MLTAVSGRRVRLLGGRPAELGLGLLQLSGVGHALILAIGQAIASRKLPTRKRRPLRVERHHAVLTRGPAYLPVGARLYRQALAGLCRRLLTGALLRLHR